MAYRTMWTNTTPANPIAVTVSGVTAHDVLIAAIVADTSNTVTGWASLPTGFVAVAEQHTTTDGQHFMVAIKADADGTEGVLTFAPNNAGNFIGAVWAFSGRDNASPQDFTADVSNNNTGQSSAWSLTSGSVTPGNNGCDILALMGSDVTSSVGGSVVHGFSTASGTTGSWTNPADVSDGGYRQMALGYATQSTAGAITITGTGTASGKSAGRAMITLGLKDGGGGGFAAKFRKTLSGIGGKVGSKQIQGMMRSASGLIVPERMAA